MLRHCETCPVLTNARQCPACAAKSAAPVVVVWTKEDEDALREIGPRGWRSRSRSFVKRSQRCLAPALLTRDED